MNSYHKNHPDPDIRQKYAEWEVANAGYQSRARGFKSVADMNKADEAPKKVSVVDMLKAMMGGVMRGVAANKAKAGAARRGKKQNLRKTGSTRGS